uniref:Peptidoglycan-binding domain 1 protein n=1 Tax=Cyanothece sp. (strain PCC 7425 / ATCC 29141) TaxID=395961 RepID=B8HTA9_CYAP4
MANDHLNADSWRPVPAALTGPVLYPWDAGPAVFELQELLNAHGFRLKLDGDFGAKTETAVGEFQRRYGLRVDGIVGPQTWVALKQKVQPGTRVLKRGHTGADVFQLQWLLQISGQQVVRDGIFGAATEQALIEFQQKHKLKPDGIVDLITWRMLRGRSLL